MPRKRSARRKCLANCCSKLVEPPAVFCRNHWDQLPEALCESIQRAILWGKHDEAVTVVAEGICYLDNHRMPHQSDADAGAGRDSKALAIWDRLGRPRH